jgi:hypothetical protein
MSRQKTRLQRGSEMRQSIPARDKVRPGAPLRLGVAAALAIPDGSMGAFDLQREGARGPLVFDRLANIERVSCHVEAGR